VDPALGMGLGTPAAAALMPGGAAAGDGLPTVARMFNLYQPYDPVAYRRAAAAVSSPVQASAIYVFHAGLLDRPATAGKLHAVRMLVRSLRIC